MVGEGWYDREGVVLKGRVVLLGRGGTTGKEWFLKDGWYCWEEVV